MLLVFSACCIWTFFISHLHMYISSAYYLHICVLCTLLSAVVLDIFLPNKQCQCALYVISTTLYRSLHVVRTYTHYLLCIFHIPHIAYYLQLSFRICLHTHMSSAHHLYIICTATHGQHGPELSFTCDRNLLLNGISGRNVQVFLFQDLCK